MSTKLFTAGTIFGIVASISTSFAAYIQSTQTTSRLDSFQEEYGFKSVVDSCAEVHGAAITIQNAVDGFFISRRILLDATQEQDPSKALALDFASYHHLHQSQNVTTLAGNFNVSFKRLQFFVSDETFEVADQLASALERLIHEGFQEPSQQTDKFIGLVNDIIRANDKFYQACQDEIGSK
jgi:hypothetical protein